MNAILVADAEASESRVRLANVIQGLGVAVNPLDAAYQVLSTLTSLRVTLEGQARLDAHTQIVVIEDKDLFDLSKWAVELRKYITAVDDEREQAHKAQPMKPATTRVAAQMTPALEGPPGEGAGPADAVAPPPAPRTDLATRPGVLSVVPGEPTPSTVDRPGPALHLVPPPNDNDDPGPAAVDAPPTTPPPAGPPSLSSLFSEALAPTSQDPAGPPDVVPSTGPDEPVSDLPVGTTAISDLLFSAAAENGAPFVNDSEDVQPALLDPGSIPAPTPTQIDEDLVKLVVDRCMTDRPTFEGDITGVVGSVQRAQDALEQIADLKSCPVRLLAPLAADQIHRGRLLVPHKRVVKADPDLSATMWGKVLLHVGRGTYLPAAAHALTSIVDTVSSFDVNDTHLTASYRSVGGLASALVLWLHSDLDADLLLDAIDDAADAGAMQISAVPSRTTMLPQVRSALVGVDLERAAIRTGSAADFVSDAMR